MFCTIFNLILKKNINFKHYWIILSSNTVFPSSIRMIRCAYSALNVYSYSY